MLDQLLWVRRHQYQIFYYIDLLEYIPDLRLHRLQISWASILWVALYQGCTTRLDSSEILRDILSKSDLRPVKA